MKLELMTECEEGVEVIRVVPSVVTWQQYSTAFPLVPWEDTELYVFTEVSSCPGLVWNWPWVFA